MPNLQTSVREGVSVNFTLRLLDSWGEMDLVLMSHRATPGTSSVKTAVLTSTDKHSLSLSESSLGHPILQLTSLYSPYRSKLKSVA
jgi:hypothetical protein